MKSGLIYSVQSLISQFSLMGNTGTSDITIDFGGHSILLFSDLDMSIFILVRFSGFLLNCFVLAEKQRKQELIIWTTKCVFCTFIRQSCCLSLNNLRVYITQRQENSYTVTRQNNSLVGSSIFFDGQKTVIRIIISFDICSYLIVVIVSIGIGYLIVCL